jgi:hypothetical protein
VRHHSRKLLRRHLRDWWTRVKEAVADAANEYRAERHAPRTAGTGYIRLLFVTILAVSATETIRRTAYHPLNSAHVETNSVRMLACTGWAPCAGDVAARGGGE